MHKPTSHLLLSSMLSGFPSPHPPVVLFVPDLTNTPHPHNGWVWAIPFKGENFLQLERALKSLQVHSWTQDQPPPQIRHLPIELQAMGYWPLNPEPGGGHMMLHPEHPPVFLDHHQARLLHMSRHLYMNIHSNWQEGPSKTFQVQVLHATESHSPYGGLRFLEPSYPQITLPRLIFV